MPRSDKEKWGGRKMTQGTMAAVAATPAIGPIIHGQKTVGTPGSPEQLRGPQPLESGVTVKALTDNTGIVYVGSNTVTSGNGFTLAADEQIFIEINDTNLVWLDVSVGQEGVSYLGS